MCNKFRGCFHSSWKAHQPMSDDINDYIYDVSCKGVVMGLGHVCPGFLDEAQENERIFKAGVEADKHLVEPPKVLVFTTPDNGSYW